jgi:heme/copper-type cytochrome/quinol oxidase subunit 1
LVAIGATLIWQTTAAAPVNPARFGRDTYYVVATGHYQIGLGLIYAVLAVVMFCIVRMNDRVTQRCAEAAFGLFHLGASVALFNPLWARSFLPKRYVSDEEAFTRINMIMSISAVVSLCAMAAIALCLMTALGRAYLRRKE